ncbi:MAG: type II secretion system F family protein [Kiritimatiellia bacterium]
MKTFIYKGYRSDGSACRGFVEALSVKGAREKLAGKGIFAERVSQGAGKTSLSSARRAMMYREMSALLGAGLTLEGALEMLVRSPDSGRERNVLSGILDRVRDGSSLASALSGTSSSVGGFECAVIESAEKSGALQVMLERMGAFMEAADLLSERVQAALVYPLIVVTVGICAAVVMLGLLIPRVEEMFLGVGRELPLLTRVMIAAGKGMGSWGLVLIAALAGWIVYSRWKLKRDEEYRRKWDRRLFGMPVVGKGYRMLVSARFSRTLAMLLSGGAGLIESLVLAGQSTGSVWTESHIKKGADAVRHGGRVSEAVRSVPPLASTVTPWIEIGETTGNLAGSLNGAADKFEARWERYVSRAMSIVEPVLILVVGGFVLVIVLSVLLPILSMADVLG